MLKKFFILNFILITKIICMEETNFINPSIKKKEKNLFKKFYSNKQPKYLKPILFTGGAISIILIIINKNKLIKLLESSTKLTSKRALPLALLATPAITSIMLKSIIGIASAGILWKAYRMLHQSCRDKLDKQQAVYKKHFSTYKAEIKEIQQNLILIINEINTNKKERLETQNNIIIPMNENIQNLNQAVENITKELLEKKKIQDLINAGLDNEIDLIKESLNNTKISIEKIQQYFEKFLNPRGTKKLTYTELQEELKKLNNNIQEIEKSDKITESQIQKLNKKTQEIYHLPINSSLKLKTAQSKDLILQKNKKKPCFCGNENEYFYASEEDNNDENSD